MVAGPRHTSDRVSAAEIRFSSVSCRYGRRVAVDGVDFTVSAGEHVAITGTNGSGKTTMLRAVLGLHPLSGGSIAVAGSIANTAAGWSARRRMVAWVPQRLAPGRFPLLVRELLGSSGNLSAALDGAGQLGVADLGERPLHTLSGGQLQRVFLARALGAVADGAQALLADEPTAALDFDGQDQVARWLAGLPVTVVVVSHDRAMSKACDRVAEMAAGRLRMV